MYSPNSTIRQSTNFINAGLAQRVDMSEQIQLVVELAQQKIMEDEGVSLERRIWQSDEIAKKVERLVHHFAPNWNYPPPEYDPTETEFDLG